MYWQWTVSDVCFGVGLFSLCDPCSLSLTAVLDGVERLTAEEMDERRQQNMAYEYLCHLEEAKR